MFDVAGLCGSHWNRPVTLNTAQQDSALSRVVRNVNSRNSISFATGLLCSLYSAEMWPAGRSPQTHMVKTSQHTSLLGGNYDRNLLYVLNVTQSVCANT